MVISERRHAVQTRSLNAQQTHAFDDLGCALLWLDGKDLRAGSDGGPEVWAKISADGDWIDARLARFESGLTTPMAYGFGASEEGLSLAEVHATVLDMERRRRSRSTTQTHKAHSHEDERGEDVE